MTAAIDLHEAISHILREVQHVMTVGSQYTRDHIVLPIRNWVIILHQSFVINHREVEPGVLDMGVDPLVLPMRGVVTIMNDYYSQLDGQSLSINHREVEELIEMDSLLLSMQSVGNIMEDSPTELHMQQETVIDLNVAIRVTQRIYRLARSAYDIMSVLTG